MANQSSLCFSFLITVWRFKYPIYLMGYLNSEDLTSTAISWKFSPASRTMSPSLKMGHSVSFSL